MKKLGQSILFLLLNAVAIILCIWNGINLLTAGVILILGINIISICHRLFIIWHLRNGSSEIIANHLVKSNFDQESIKRHSGNVEYSNNLLKLMYRQEDIQKAINFIGNEFNVAKYNYFFIADIELVSIISDEIIPVSDTQSLIAIVYQNGRDKFLDVSDQSHKIESALGQKAITNLYYVVLVKDEKKYGIAELGFPHALETEVLENLKMCLNELTKF